MLLLLCFTLGRPGTLRPASKNLLAAILIVLHCLCTLFLLTVINLFAAPAALSLPVIPGAAGLAYQSLIFHKSEIKSHHFGAKQLCCTGKAARTKMTLFGQYSISRPSRQNFRLVYQKQQLLCCKTEMYM